VQPQIEIAYLGLEVPDPGSLTSFFADVIGLVPGEPGDEGTITWRNDDRAHRVIVEPGAANDAAFVGFEAVDDEAFDATVARLGAAGFAVAEGNDDDRRRRRVGRLARTTSPWGVAVEIVTGLEAATSGEA